ncbi:TIGR03936 family radical SAM-associated protein [Clostridium sp. LBM24168]
MVRYLIKFSKESSVKFIGHLDVMRTIQRMIRRSRLPVQYSRGFNPHINMSIAQPLSVGVYSCGEYMDICFEKEVEEDEIKCRLNENAPVGIRIFEAKKIKDNPGKKIFKSMAEVYAARYIIKIKYLDASNLLVDINNVMKKDMWKAMKKSKRGEAETDIKKFIKEMNYRVEDNILILDTVISCGSRNNLSAGLLANYIQNNTRQPDKNAFVDIMRKEMYSIYNDKLIPLISGVEL